MRSTVEGRLGRLTIVVVAITVLTALIELPAICQTPTSDAGGENSAALRVFAASTDGAAPEIAPDDLPLGKLFSGPNARIYLHPELVRRTIADDAAITAFLQSRQYGAQFRQVLNQAVLYAGIPRRGFFGFNSYNQMPLPAAGPGLKRAIAREKVTQQQPAVQTPAPQSASPTTPTPNLPLFGQIQIGQPVKAGSASADAVAQRVAGVRAAFPRDLSTVVSISADGSRATLYVFGRFPHEPNPEVSTDFTVIRKEYSPSPLENESGAPTRADSAILVDKQNLTPTTEAEDKYFCYIYRLETPPAGGQVDMLVTYWMTPTMGFTHGVAVGRGANGEWTAIPMTRVERFQRDFRYQNILNTDVGDQLPLYAYGRRVKK